MSKIEEAITKLPAGDAGMAERLAAADSAMKSLGIALTALNRRSDDIAASVAQARERADAAVKAVAELRASLQDAAKNFCGRNFAGRTRRLAKAHRRARTIRQGRARRHRESVLRRYCGAARLERRGSCAMRS